VGRKKSSQQKEIVIYLLAAHCNFSIVELLLGVCLRFRRFLLEHKDEIQVRHNIIEFFFVVNEKEVLCAILGASLRTKNRERFLP
jgi:hypothetical protein